MATRWHEDDLIGRCLNQTHENWQLSQLEAVNGEDDNRKALWPGRGSRDRGARNIRRASRAFEYRKNQII